MKDQVILCPNCKKEIALTEALMDPIEGTLRKEYDKRLRDEKSRLSDEMEKRESGIHERETQLRSMSKELDRSRKELEEIVSKRVSSERSRLTEEIEKKARNDLKMELHDLKDQITDKEKRLEEATRNELKLRKDQRMIEERERNLELELNRKLDLARKKIEEDARTLIEEQYQLRYAEKDKAINDLKDQINILKRKAEQGSQQMQGEVMELAVEDLLERSFPYDSIEPVPKGVRGADIVQRVHSENGAYCGTIIWEIKRTKNWVDDWIPKLKDDQRAMKADLAVICSVALPKDVGQFEIRKNIMITSPHLALPVAGTLRNQLMETTRIRKSSEGRHEKKDLLYTYLTGNEFRQKMEAIVEAFMEMKGDLDKERASLAKIWEKREKQMFRALTNIGSMYGSMQGIAGASLPEIRSLDLESLTEGSTEISDSKLDEF